MSALLESGRPGSARVRWVRGAKGREVFVAMSDVAAALGFLGSSGRSDEVGEAPQGSPPHRSARPQAFPLANPGRPRRRSAKCPIGPKPL